MPYCRLFFSFGLILLSFSSEAQLTKSLDSLRTLATVIAQDSSSNDLQDLVVIKQFLNEAKLDRSNEDIIFAYQQLAAINYKVGNTNQALHYYKLYIIELENLSTTKNLKQQRFEKNLYENEIKALSIKISSLEQENNEAVVQISDLLKKNNWIYLGLRIMLVIATVLLLGWLYFKYKRPKKKVEEIKIKPSSESITEVIAAQKEELSKAQTELELADLLVQEIISHPDDTFAANKSIRKKFLIHQPKNMAGGDGLYLSTERYKTLIIAFDTPGYGAAGGLLSTRTYNLLDELVKKHHIVSPNLIMNQMEINLLNLFPAGVPFSGGIEMAACLYNSTEKTLTYSGANMDLFVVQRGILNKHAAASKSLIDDNPTLEYTNSVIDISRGTNIYLSTKGYWSQQGGHDHKPLGQATFEKTIESLSTQPITEHETVMNKIFNDWKGGNEQNDDVMVLGLGF